MTLSASFGETLSALTLRMLGQLADAARGGRGCFFTFHRAAPPTVWEKLANRDFYLDSDFLERLIVYLKETGWRIVTVEEAMRLSAAGARERFVNFSVDDCYRDTFELVVPLFRRHGVPVTLFLTTGIPDAGMPLWGAGLEQILGDKSTVIVEGVPRDVSSDALKRAAYAEIAARWDGPQAGACYSRFCAENGYDEDALHWQHAMSWEMLEAVAGDPLVEIGGHTITHPRVSALDPERAFTELEGCRRRIEERLGIAVGHFAFPYGRSGDCGPRDFALTQKAGYRSAATTTKGLLRAGADPHRLPRNTLNGRHRSLALAELHLTGATGLAARMMNRV